MVNDGIKKSGRLLKKGSVVLDKVRVADYDFGEISVSEVVLLDNQNSNILHNSLHNESDMEKAVLQANDFNDELIDVAQKPPVLFPRDFTGEWLEAKRRSKGRKKSLFDDEDDDIENPFMDNEQNEVESKETKEPKLDDIAAQNQISHDAEVHQTEDGGDYSVDRGAMENLQQGEDMSVDDSFQVVGDAINEMAQNTPEATNDEESHTDFVPVDMAATHEGEAIEDQALEEYKKQKAIEEIDVESIKEEAKARGYEEGYRNGEEKATIQSQEQAKEIFRTINALVEEFQNLKNDVLDNIQDNFIELSTAMSESIVNRAVKIDPKIFSDIIHRAVSESVQSDEFKVRVSPQIFKLLSNADIGEMKDTFIVDESFGFSDFKIESELGVVESNVKKIIDDLMESANIQLFDSEEKAS